MGYAGNFLKRYGQIATINRTPSVTARVNLKRSTKSIFSASARDSMFEGLIESSSNLASGETFSIGSGTYITQTADYDYASKEIIVFAVRANATCEIWRQTETADKDFNIERTWELIQTDIHCYKEVITRTQRQYDAGLLDNAIYILQLSKNVPVFELDRIILDSNYKVEAIDDSLEGVYKIQLSKDTRP